MALLYAIYLIVGFLFQSAGILILFGQVFGIEINANGLQAVINGLAIIAFAESCIAPKIKSGAT